MKQLGIVVVVAALGGALFAFRGAFWQPAGAAGGRESAARLDRASGTDRPAPRAALAGVVPAGGEGLDGSASGALLARLAAECGNHLFARLDKEPDNPHLLNQAAAHYRACLAHEPTTRDDALFAAVRKKLQQVERLQARLRADQAPAPKSAPAKRVETRPAPPPSPPEEAAPAPAKKAGEESRMVGPDGVSYRRVSD